MLMLGLPAVEKHEVITISLLVLLSIRDVQLYGAVQQYSTYKTIQRPTRASNNGFTRGM